MENFNATNETHKIDLTGDIKRIKKFIENKRSLIIEKPLNSGQSMILTDIEKILKDEYIVILLNFEHLKSVYYNSEKEFCEEFMNQAIHYLMHSKLNFSMFTESEKDYIIKWNNPRINNFISLATHINEMCADREVALLIDGIDSRIEHKVFSIFLETLETMKALAKAGKGNMFHSMVFVFEYDDINSERIYYTPSDMEYSKENISLNIADIKQTLIEYKTINNINIDTADIARRIYDYTDGNPFLVTTVCLYIEKKLDNDWTPEGVTRAINLLLKDLIAGNDLYILFN